MANIFKRYNVYVKMSGTMIKLGQLFWCVFIMWMFWLFVFIIMARGNALLYRWPFLKYLFGKVFPDEVLNNSRWTNVDLEHDFGISWNILIAEKILIIAPKEIFKYIYGTGRRRMFCNANVVSNGSQENFNHQNEKIRLIWLWNPFENVPVNRLTNTMFFQHPMLSCYDCSFVSIHCDYHYMFYAHFMHKTSWRLMGS